MYMGYAATFRYSLDSSQNGYKDCVRVSRIVSH